MCVGAGKWCLKIAREWSAAREQWGKPVAEHEAVGAKIAFIAATTFALEAVVDLSLARWPTRTATTSASRPRSPSCTAPRWPG